MRGRQVRAVLVLVVATLFLGTWVVLAGDGSEPTKMMTWIVALVTPIICVPVIQIAKGILVKVLGDGLTSAAMKYVAWGLSYVVAIVAYIIGGVFSGVNGLQQILTGGWTTLITGAIPVLANAAYLLVESKLESLGTKMARVAPKTRRR